MNILWMVMDHVTFRHYRLTKGVRPILKTYESLAAEGTEFTNCHSVHPLCLPARASMLTGVYAHKHRKIRNGDNFPDTGYPLVFDSLRQQGYAVGYFGKNHSGFENFRSRGIEGFFPRDYGNPYRSEAYREYLRSRCLENPVYRQEWHIRSMGREDGDYDLTREDNFNTYSAGYIASPGRVHESDFVTELAGDWIDQAARRNHPFAVRVDTWGPHQAYQVPLEYKDRIDATQIPEYPGFTRTAENVCPFATEFIRKIRQNNPCQTWESFRHIVDRAYEQYSYIDAAFGRLLKRLKEIGVYDDTAIILTADHGDSLGSHGGMFDKCGDMAEELMDIPLVIRLPSSPGRQKSDVPVTNMDIMPTVLAMAGCPVPEYVDGRNLLPWMEHTGAPIREDLMCEHYGHFDVHDVQRAVYFAPYKYVAAQDGTELLYNLKTDPFEMQNLAIESGAFSILKEMRSRLRRNLLRFGDTFETDGLLK